MNRQISRRDFLKLGLTSLGAIAFSPILQDPEQAEEFDGLKVARVATRSVSVYSEPSDKSTIIRQHFRDELVNVYYDIISEHGPKYNPLWHRVWGGYMHSPHLVPVNYKLNPILPYIAKSGQLAEVTVPFSQSMTYKKKQGWQNLYRLYYESVHWIRDIVEGPDGTAWYKIEDELDGRNIYYVPASHLRPILPEELEPISPDIDPWSKLIEVSIYHQTLTAYEGDKVVLKTKVSTGLIQAVEYEEFPDAISTKTPTGKHNVEVKMPSKHMGDGRLTADINAYELPGVPWCCFFVPSIGVAFHGTYWHTNFGNPMSHGCVNMRTEEAKWLYRWTTPVAGTEIWEKRGYGTRVVVK